MQLSTEQQKIVDASREIKAVLTKYDLTLFGTLHTPGTGAVLTELSSTRSGAVMEGDSLGFDLNLDNPIKAEETLEMLNFFSEMTGKYAKRFQSAEKVIRSQVERFHGKKEDNCPPEFDFESIVKEAFSKFKKSIEALADTPCDCPDCKAERN